MLKHLFLFCLVCHTFTAVWAQSRPELIPYRKGDKWGYCDTNRVIKIPVVYDEAYPFIQGKALVNYKGRACKINKRGIVVKRFSFKLLGSYNTDLIEIEAKKSLLGKIDLAGKVVFKPIYSEITKINDETYEMVHQGKVGRINLQGEVVKPFVPHKPAKEVLIRLYRYEQPCRVGKAGLPLTLMNHKRKHGYVDKNLQLQIPFKYAFAGDFVAGVARVGFTLDNPIPKNKPDYSDLYKSKTERVYHTYIDCYGNTYYEEKSDANKTALEKALKVAHVKVQSGNGFLIETSKKYISPNVKQTAIAEVATGGAFDGFTVIHDASIRSIADLNKYYPLAQLNFPERQKFNQPKYVVLKYANGQLQPVIVDIEGNVFGFTISNKGRLNIYFKSVYINGKGEYRYKTHTSYLDKK